MVYYGYMKPLNDHTLIKQYLKGDEASFEILVQKYMELMYRFVYRYANDAQTAEDITQEVFLKVWRNAKKIDKNKNFKSWLYTVAKNTALDFIKKKKAIPFSKFENEQGKNYLTEKLVDNNLLPSKISEGLEFKHNFLIAIGSLSSKYQLVLTLYYYQYLNFREIAEVLKEPINTIKSRHRRGVILLKKVMGDALDFSHNV